eukprot:TRINITY_DN2303_c0_g2_i1.p1 TRINITY_DN2303_c0_g2~~TRINITY_DN2303_c0_g2_i1.p1  ORF type:complete len:1174 (-),score=289.93 TRINITY_DN2303_c0_g2_i1:50-3571(-)
MSSAMEAASALEEGRKRSNNSTSGAGTPAKEIFQMKNMSKKEKEREKEAERQNFMGKLPSSINKNSEPEQEKITWRSVGQTLISPTSWAYIGISVLFTVCVGLTDLVGFRFFALLTEFFSACLMLMTFLILILAHQKTWDAFFTIVGIGYGFFGILRALYMLMYPWVDTGIADLTNQSLQIRICFDFFEFVAFLVGTLLAKKSWDSVKPVIIIFSIFTVICTFFLCAIFWWDIFPTTYHQSNGTYTTFKDVADWFTPFSYLLVAAILVYQRNNFSADIFTYLMIALILRSLSTGLRLLTEHDYEGNAANVTALLSRLMAFTYIFSVMGISTMKNPTKTLFRNLSSRERALRREKLFAEWMIDQTPGIVVLLNEFGEITHVNRLVKEVLNVSKKQAVGQSFLQFFVATTYNSSSSASPTNNTTSSGTPNEHSKDNKPVPTKSRSKQRAGSRDWNFEEIMNNTLNHGTVTLEASFPKSDRVIEWRFSSINITHRKAPRSKSTDKSNSESESDIEMQDSSSTISSGSSGGDERTVVMCLGQDITDKYQREALLTHARNEAQQLAEMKETFVANVSHELRTPLNCIVGVASLLVNSVLTAHQKEMVNMIVNAANVLLDLINDLLDVNSIRQGTLKLQMTTVNLKSFLEELIFSVSLHPQLAQNKDLDFGYRVHFKCPPQFITDEKRLRQIMVNLVSNAMKFTAKGQILVTIDVFLKEGYPGSEDHPEEIGESRKCSAIKTPKYLEFRVSDSGVGIKAEDISKLFQRFSQVEATNTRKYQGTGIGLHISKQLVEMLGGNIGVDSKVGRGSTFWFTLPVEEGEFTEFSKSPALVPNQKTLVLLKNKKISALLAESLTKDNGFPAASVADIKELSENLSELAENTGVDRPEKKEDGNTFSEATPPSSSPSSRPADSTGSPRAESVAAKERKLTIDSDSLQITIIVESDFMDSLPLGAMEHAMSRGAKLMMVAVSANPNSSVIPAKDELKRMGVPVHVLGKPIQISWLVEYINSAINSTLPQLVSYGSGGSLVDHINGNDQETAEVPDKEPTEPKRKRKVLIVEDNLVNQRVLSMLLDKLGGYDYDVASNGMEAVDHFNSTEKYDAILMDCQMPIMDGIQATEIIRKTEEEQNKERTIIIAVTANAMDGDRQEWTRAGMDSYLVKPINFLSLKEKLQLLLD